MEFEAFFGCRIHLQNKLICRFYYFIKVMTWYEYFAFTILYKLQTIACIIMTFSLRVYGFDKTKKYSLLARNDVIWLPNVNSSIHLEALTVRCWT